MLSDKRFQDIKPDYSFALKNLPGFPENNIIISQDGFCSASTGLLLKLRHDTQILNAGENSNFSLACGEIITNIPRICDDMDTQSKANIIYIQMGKQNLNKAPEQAEIRIRLSSENDAGLEEIKTSALEYINKISQEHNLEYIHEFSDSFPGLESTKDALDIIKKTCQKKDKELIIRDTIFPWSDDFGHFAQISSIALFGIGAGVNHPPRGSAHYDFPDRLIHPTIEFLSGILSELEII